MIKWAGFLYGIAKDLKEYFDFKEEDKLVDIKWPENSGFSDYLDKQGL